jgi:hypothetical protein
MDPYLERRNVWPDVHSALIVATRDTLAPQVAPVYYVAASITASATFGHSE